MNDMEPYDADREYDIGQLCGCASFLVMLGALIILAGLVNEYIYRFWIP
jgi:hypothetical protein